MKNYTHIIIGAIFGMQLGIFVDLVFGIFFDTALKSWFHQKSSEAVVDRLFSPAATIFASIVATIGVAIVIFNQNRIAEISRKNRLMAARSLFYLPLFKIDEACKYYVLKAFHGDEYKSSEPPVLSDGEMEKINTVIENSNQKIQKNLGNLFIMYQISLGEYNGFVNNRENHKPPNGKKMSEKLIGVIVNLISLRALIQCYYLYGIDGDFEKFEPDLENAELLFNMMICTFAEYDGKHTPTYAEEEIKEYIKISGPGFLKENYLDNLNRNIKAALDS